MADDLVRAAFRSELKEFYANLVETYSVLEKPCLIYDRTLDTKYNSLKKLNDIITKYLWAFRNDTEKPDWIVRVFSCINQINKEGKINCVLHVIPHFLRIVTRPEELELSKENAFHQ